MSGGLPRWLWLATRPMAAAENLAKRARDRKGPLVPPRVLRGAARVLLVAAFAWVAVAVLLAQAGSIPSWAAWVSVAAAVTVLVTLMFLRPDGRQR